MVSKIDYELNDAKLINSIRENNDEAKDYLYTKYSPLIHKEINRVRPQAYVLGIDLSDLSQEAMLAFTNAINSYDENANVKFITFATLCIRRKLLNMLAKYSTNKNMAMKTSIPLDSNIEDSNSTLIDFLKDSDEKDPLNHMITNESIDEINKVILEKLSENERIAFQQSIQGKSVEEISKILNMTPKQIYNLIYRARGKIKSN